jgi:hypothetical protein
MDQTTLTKGQTMRLTQLHIRRKSKYEDPNESLTGEVTFTNEKNKIETKINISNAAAIRIVELCAEGIVDAGHELAQMIIDDLKEDFSGLPDRTKA